MRSLCNEFFLKTFFFQNNRKVAVLGASGGIGQPLSLLLKQNPGISHLALYDIAHTPGVAADLSHIDTPAKVTGKKLQLAPFSSVSFILTFCSHYCIF